MEKSGTQSTPKEENQADNDTVQHSVLDNDGIGVFCWLMKDLGWCLLLGCICFPAAALAILIESQALFRKWKKYSVAFRVHCVVLLMWLIGNAIWMFGELNFNPSPEPGRDFFWYHEPYMGENKEAYSNLTKVCQVFFITGVMTLLIFYAMEAWHFRKGVADDVADEDKLVLGWITPQVYGVVFVGPWIMKDLCWTVDCLWGGLIFGTIVLALVVDCYRRFRTVEYIAETCWVVGNIAWICAEDLFGDKSHWPRITAGCSLGCGVLITVCALGLSNGISRDGERRKIVAEQKPAYS